MSRRARLLSLSPRALMQWLRYAIEALAACLCLGLFRLLPWSAASYLGGKMGQWVGPLLPAHRVAQRNLSLVFPDMNALERDAIIRQMWNNLGRNIGEFPHISSLSQADSARYVTIEGLEHLLALPEGAAIMVSAHYGNWEMQTAVSNHYGMPVSLIYRHANNPLVDAIIRWMRRGVVVQQFTKETKQMRLIMKTVEEGGRLGMLCDQKLSSGEPVEFFGRPAMTTTLAAQLALKYSSPILLWRISRRGNSAHFRLQIMRLAEPDASLDKKARIMAITESINGAFEDWIREDPAQWFWVHKRWDKALYR